MAALASQSLAIMISLIPYIRETFRRHLSTKQAVMLIEFDKIKRDYQEHQNEIHAKLIAIMGDRLTAHIRTLQVRFLFPSFFFYLRLTKIARSRQSSGTCPRRAAASTITWKSW